MAEAEAAERIPTIVVDKPVEIALPMHIRFLIHYTVERVIQVAKSAVKKKAILLRMAFVFLEILCLEQPVNFCVNLINNTP